MLEQQLVTRGIRDPRVLRAMTLVPRHRFVPPDLVAEAWEDRPLPIGHGQSISQPYIVAFMSEALRLTGTEKVLEIGTGCGYQSAVLSELAAEVYSVEIIDALAREAAERLRDLRYDNVRVQQGDGRLGWPDGGPFDAILVAAAPDRVPGALVDQLRVGGRLVLPVGTEQQELILVEKTETGVREQSLLPVRFVPMTGAGPGD